MSAAERKLGAALNKSVRRARKKPRAVDPGDALKQAPEASAPSALPAGADGDEAGASMTNTAKASMSAAEKEARAPLRSNRQRGSKKKGTAAAAIDAAAASIKPTNGVLVDSTIAEDAPPHTARVASAAKTGRAHKKKVRFRANGDGRADRGSNAQLKALREAVARVAAGSDDEFELCRIKEAKRHNVRVGEFEKMVKAAREEAAIARLQAMPEHECREKLEPEANRLGYTNTTKRRAFEWKVAQARRARKIREVREKAAAGLEQKANGDPGSEAASEAAVESGVAATSSANGFAILDTLDEGAGCDQPTSTGNRSSHLVNLLQLVTYITTTVAWDGVLRFNQHSQNCEVWPPFPPKGDPAAPPRALEDPYDTLLATIYFQANGFDAAGKNLVWDALIAVAHDNPYHPIKDYLNGLRWDGVARVGSFFQRYFKAELPPESDRHERDRHVSYLQHISTSFMVGAVARIMQPGCKHDHVPVVIGRDQGTQKSRAIQALCPDPAWFTDNVPPDLTDRDTKEGLNGKWIVELSEIPHVRREVEQWKGFLSSQVDRYRAPYGRATQDHPRQCVFVGTSNDLEFIDVTGNRRLWPFVSLGMIDAEAIERDRDQLWAEAVTLYRDGVRWWLAPAVEQIAAERQEAFVETDVWDGLIESWISGRQRAHPGPFKMEDLFAANSGIVPYRELAATQKADEVRAARCLKRLGFYRSRCTHNGKRAYWWLCRLKPSADPPPGAGSPTNASPTAVKADNSAADADASSDDVEVL